MADNEPQHRYFNADKTSTCGSPHCSNRLSGENISNGEEYCSEECAADHIIGSDMVLFDNPYDPEEGDEDDFEEDED